MFHGYEVVGLLVMCDTYSSKRLHGSSGFELFSLTFTIRDGFWGSSLPLGASSGIDYCVQGEGTRLKEPCHPKVSWLLVP